MYIYVVNELYDVINSIMFVFTCKRWYVVSHKIKIMETW